MFRKVILSILIVSMAVSLGLSIYSGIIPNGYLIGLALVYLCLGVISAFLVKRKKKILLILGVILSLLLVAVSIILSIVLIRVQLIFDNVSNVNTEVGSYSVAVLKSSDYYKIEDVIGADLGILSAGDDYYNKALKALEDKGNFKYEEYDNEFVLATSLIDKEVAAIVLNEAYISILDEGIEGFADDIRILDVTQVEVEEKITSDNEINLEANEAFNVYISGIDTYGEIASVSRSDVNIIATINPSTGKILLTNVPRDMYVQLAGTNELKDKLTHAGVYGINTSIDTLENFLDIDISYYVRINFSSLIKLVDYIGGIDVYSSYAFKAGDRYYTQGMNYNLNGQEALAFSRNRYAFSDGDRQRGRNQEQVIAAIINKVTQSKDINVYLNLLTTLENSFQTNMDKATINSFVHKQLENNYNWEIMFSDVNGYDSSNYTYSYPWQKLYVMEVDSNSLNNAKVKINSVLNGN